MTQSAIYNKSLDAFQVPRDVYNAIKTASAKTGVNFSYMVEKAAVESGFDKNAKAKSSSATGLYQFIESTWLSMVEKHGDKYGLGQYADKIDSNGRVSDPKARREILELRKDPEIASYMAAEFAGQNYDHLAKTVGGTIGKTELYMAHFLGAGGASGFLSAMKKSPNMAAADLFPKEARANRNVFYEPKTGRPRTMSEVYAFFDKKFAPSGTGNSSTQVAAVNRNFNTAQNDSVLRKTAADAYAGRTTQAARVIVEDNPLDRLTAIMTSFKPSTPMRGAGAAEESIWQVFPPSLYNRLSLTAAQMMMLDNFNA